MGKLDRYEVIFSLLCGTNGTGKSTILRKILDSSKKRVLVLPSNQSESTFSDLPMISSINELKTFTGARKIMCYEPDDFKEIAPHIENCVLITDDFKNYLEGNMPRDVRRLFIDRRHKNIDIYMACHGFTEVPPKLWTWLDFIFLFRTMDNPQRVRQYILNFDQLSQLQGKVNAVAQSNPYHYEIFKNV